MSAGRRREYVTSARPLPTAMPSELEIRRERLRREFAELQFDLGGLAYEMALRGDFRVEVLARRAERLRIVDAELGSVERQLPGAGGR